MSSPSPTRTRPWRCLHCHQQLALVVYQRGQRTALVPDDATSYLARVAGLRLDFRCRSCQALRGWLAREFVRLDHNPPVR